jgi:hypothetical protein
MFATWTEAVPPVFLAEGLVESTGPLHLAKYRGSPGSLTLWQAYQGQVVNLPHGWQVANLPHGACTVSGEVGQVFAGLRFRLTGNRQQRTPLGTGGGGPIEAHTTAGQSSGALTLGSGARSFLGHRPTSLTMLCSLPLVGACKRFSIWMSTRMGASQNS